MACEVCLETFEAAPNDLTRVPFIDKQQPNCCCEDCKVSDHCDTPVGSDEVLVRIVMDPDHLHPESDGFRLKSTFFSDAETVGASCIRQGRASAEEYIRTVELIIQAKPKLEDGTARGVYGVVLVPVIELRKLSHAAVAATPQKAASPEVRAFGAYATGESDRPNHADIMASGFEFHSRSKILKAGKKLTEASAGRLLLITEFKDADLRGWKSSKL